MPHGYTDEDGNNLSYATHISHFIDAVRRYRLLRFTLDRSMPSSSIPNSMGRRATERDGGSCPGSAGKFGSLNTPSSKRLYHNTYPS